jgi:uncharacterized protein
MFGISWGGFNSLQIAARQPPALKAIITICSTDDRYADDVHYIGGCIMAMDMLPWASTMLAYNCRPPDPAVVGDGWRATWLRRVAESPPYVERWLAHQRRDAYWAQGSVCEDYSRIRCPVYAVAGWADGYKNAVLRLMAGLSVPRKGLLGPWGHQYPEAGLPGPAVGFQAEALRWWDHWLKGRDTGVMAGPALRCWVQDWVHPAGHHAVRPGTWIGEAGWPSDRVGTRRLHLHPASLAPNPPSAPAEVSAPAGLRSGSESGAWWGRGSPGDSPPDQRPEDRRAWAVAAPAAAADEVLMGRARVELTVATGGEAGGGAGRGAGLLAVRLCDVSACGASLLVSRGLLNLAHRAGHAAPSPPGPGQLERVVVELDAAAHRLAAGHRWRLAVSAAYWPLAWPMPSPQPVRIFLGPGRAGHLDLPIRRAGPGPLDAVSEEWAAPAGTPVARPEEVRAATGRRRRVEEDGGGWWVVVDESDSGTWRGPDGLEWESRAVDRHRIREGDALSARCACERREAVGRGEWRTAVEADSEMGCDAAEIWVTSRVVVREGDTIVAVRESRASFPRDFV